MTKISLPVSWQASGAMAMNSARLTALTKDSPMSRLPPFAHLTATRPWRRASRSGAWFMA